MVMPWMNNGNIKTFTKSLLDASYPFDLLYKHTAKWVRPHFRYELPTSDTNLVQCEQIALGLAYLHSEEIVHSDLRGVSRTIYITA